MTPSAPTRRARVKLALTKLELHLKQLRSTDQVKARPLLAPAHELLTELLQDKRGAHWSDPLVKARTSQALQASWAQRRAQRRIQVADGASPPRVVTEAEALRLLGISLPTFRMYLSRGGGSFPGTVAGGVCVFSRAPDAPPDPQAQVPRPQSKRGHPRDQNHDLVVVSAEDARRSYRKPSKHVKRLRRAGPTEPALEVTQRGYQRPPTPPVKPAPVTDPGPLEDFTPTTGAY